MIIVRRKVEETIPIDLKPKNNTAKLKIGVTTVVNIFINCKNKNLS